MNKLKYLKYTRVLIILIVSTGSSCTFDGDNKGVSTKMNTKTDKSKMKLIKVDSVTNFKLSDDISVTNYGMILSTFKSKLTNNLIKSLEKDEYQLIHGMDSCYNTKFSFFYEGSINNFWHLYKLRNMNFWLLIDTKNHFRLGFGNELLFNKSGEVFPNGLMVLDEYFRPDLRIFIDTNSTNIALQNIDYSISSSDHLNGFQLILKDTTLQHGIEYNQISFETIFKIYNSYRKGDFKIDKKIAIHVGQDYGSWPCWDNAYCLLPWGFELRDSIINDVRTFVYSYSDFKYEE